MESVSVASKVRDSLTTRFLREIRFDRREQGRFSAKPPAGPILHERKARKYLCYCNRFIRSIPVSSDGKKVGRRLWRKKRREKHRAVNMQLGCVHGLSATLLKQNTTKYEIHGQRFVSDRELAGMLRVSRRTLSDYHSAGILPYYLISGKTLYKESNIQQMLKKTHKSTFR